MSDFTFRFAEPKDAKAFSEWTGQNEQIDPNDIQAASKAQNPTVLYFVAEKDGVPVAFAPVYLAAVLAHLGLNPDAKATDRLRALEVLKNGVSAFMVQYGIREIQTLSLPEYNVAKWAQSNGFEAASRTLFTLDLNKEMAGTEVE
jgi:hypothetical protein